MESQKKTPKGKSDGLNPHLTLTLTSPVISSKVILVIPGLSFLTWRVGTGREALGPHQ